LWLGQPVKVVDHPRAELVQSSERQIHLPFNARRPLDATFFCLFGGILEQRGLPDSCLAVDNERAALTRANGIDQLIEHVALASATN
jgi:hypothetical protein